MILSFNEIWILILIPVFTFIYFIVDFRYIRHHYNFFSLLKQSGYIRNDPHDPRDIDPHPGHNCGDARKTSDRHTNSYVNIYSEKVLTNFFEWSYEIEKECEGFVGVDEETEREKGVLDGEVGVGDDYKGRKSDEKVERGVEGGGSNGAKDRHSHGNKVGKDNKSKSTASLHSSSSACYRSPAIVGTSTLSPPWGPVIIALPTPRAVRGQNQDSHSNSSAKGIVFSSPSALFSSISKFEEDGEILVLTPVRSNGEGRSVDAEEIITDSKGDDSGVAVIAVATAGADLSAFSVILREVLMTVEERHLAPSSARSSGSSSASSGCSGGCCSSSSGGSGSGSSSYSDSCNDSRVRGRTNSSTIGKSTSSAVRRFILSESDWSTVCFLRKNSESKYRDKKSILDHITESVPWRTYDMFVQGMLDNQMIC